VTELAEVRALLADQRLVTLTGAGGCGKTRLALKVLEEVGRDFADGVVILDLAPLSDEAAVATALAQVLGLRDTGPAALELVTRLLERKRVLMLLDTCEHLIGTCAAVVEALLRRCGDVTVLATSREPLGLDGETIYRVPSLAVPEPGALDIARIEAVELFVDRARRARPNFVLDPSNRDAVGAICRRLDGLPLAVELAAARVRMMSVEQIVRGLDDRFRLLTGGARTAMPRQRTLQASVEWSVALLTQPEQALFRRLAVFPSSFSLDAAEAIGAGEDDDALPVLEHLSSLVDRSLVQATEGGRYRLLETIRHFAQGLLALDPEDAAMVRDRLLRFIGRAAERARYGVESPEVFDWLEHLELEHDNIVTALTWAEQTERFDQIADVASNLGRFWRLRGKSVEGRGYLARAMASDLPIELSARAGVTAAEIALWQWDLPAAESLATQGLEALRELGDDELLARALVVLGGVTAWTALHEQAQEYHSRAEKIARDRALPAAHANALYGLSMVFFASGDFPRSRAGLEESADEARACGEVEQLLNSLWNLILLCMHTGRDEAAEEYLREGLDLAQRLGDRDHCAVFLCLRAFLRSRAGDHAEAERLLNDASMLADTSASPLPTITVVGMRAFHARDLGDLDAALEDAGQAGATFQALKAHLPAALALSHAAEMACMSGAIDRAAELTERVRDLERDLAGVPFAAWAEAHLALSRGDLEGAEDHAHLGLAQALAGGFDPHTLELLELLGFLAISLGSAAEGARLVGAVDHARADRSWVRPAGLARMYAETFASIRDDPAYAEGAAMSLEEAAAYARRGRGERKRPSFGWSSLTPTELQVVELVSDGLSNPEIAEKLFVSLATVKSHLSHVFSKLGLKSRLQLAQEHARRRAG
jgi:predicted ATPase/DNA-binding CsgD family transcriptional regulator